MCMAALRHLPGQLGLGDLENQALPRQIVLDLNPR